jgi:hypothetical protein
MTKMEQYFMVALNAPTCPPIAHMNIHRPLCSVIYLLFHPYLAHALTNQYLNQSIIITGEMTTDGAWG